jgi:hypothetical protein
MRIWTLSYRSARVWAIARRILHGLPRAVRAELLSQLLLERELEGER